MLDYSQQFVSQVLYANSYHPIKWFTLDVLNALKKDKFSDDNGDEEVVNEESVDTGRYCLL